MACSDMSPFRHNEMVFSGDISEHAFAALKNNEMVLDEDISEHAFAAL